MIEAPGSNPPKVETRHAKPGGKAPLWNDEFVVELSPATTELVLTVCGQSMYDGHTMQEVIGSGANFETGEETACCYFAWIAATVGPVMLLASYLAAHFFPNCRPTGLGSSAGERY